MAMAHRRSGTVAWVASFQHLKLLRHLFTQSSLWGVQYSCSHEFIAACSPLLNKGGILTSPHSSSPSSSSPASSPASSLGTLPRDHVNHRTLHQTSLLGQQRRKMRGFAAAGWEKVRHRERCDVQVFRCSQYMYTTRCRLENRVGSFS